MGGLPTYSGAPYRSGHFSLKMNQRWFVAAKSTVANSVAAEAGLNAFNTGNIFLQHGAYREVNITFPVILYR